MSCCGQRRASWSAPPPSGTGVARWPPAAPPGPLQRLVYEYTGREPMALASAATGKRYRFDRQGARVVVDVRDRALMDRHADLRQVT